MVSAARRQAVRCLLAVERGAWSNLTIKKDPAVQALSERDMPFFTRIFYGVLERSVTLDHILTQNLHTPLGRLDGEVLAILRSGLLQCLYMDAVPVSAAVSESVELCRSFKKSSAAPLVNAVLRKAASFDLSSLDKVEDPVERLSLRGSVCRELAAMFASQYPDCAEELLLSTFGRKRVYARVNTLRTSDGALVERLAAEGVEAARTGLGGCLELLSGRYTRCASMEEGLLRIEGYASQQAAAALAAQPGERILDCCAAPGGKSLTAAQRMENRGSVTALDISPARLALIGPQAALEGVTIVRAAAGDAASFRDRPFDRVLCDVPCSGTGMLAAKPELRRKAPEPGRFAALQASILENAASLVREGGRLVYSTCSLDRRENEEVAEKFFENHPGFRPVVTAGGEKFQKFLPQNGSGEGFFIASAERMW